MSRVGKAPITLPQGVSADVKEAVVTVKGPKGQLQVEVKPPCAVELEKEAIKVTRPDDSRQNRSSHGLYRALLNNAVVGVSQGFEKRLEIVGVGYRAEVAGNVLKLNLGFAFTKEFPIPEGISISVEKEVIVVSGIDRQKVGNVAASIRAYRPPEPYKGKGIRYQGEYIRRKAGKAAVGTGT